MTNRQNNLVRDVLFVLFLAAFAWSAALVASTPSGGDRLYRAVVSVEDRSEDTRSDAIETAGKQVLTRVTGYRDPDAREEMEAVMDRLEGLVDSFRYTTDDDDELKLEVQFDSDALDRAIRDAEAPLWGRERPRTLVWLAIRDGGERELLTEEEARERAPELLEVAEARGLPLLFPIMDIEDRSAVSFADVWGGFDEEVLEASARYASNAILIARAERAAGDRWSARWNLYEPDGDIRWRSDSGDRGQVLAEGLHEAADRFAAQFAVIGDVDADERIELRIRELERLEDYVEVERYLRDMTPVENVRLESLERDTAVFSLAVRGGRHSLDQAIRLGSRLVPVDTADEPQDAAGLVPVETLPTYRYRS